ncbi:MAG: cobalamin biosynthesis protein CobD [Chloroflexi bacterium]|nr:cobalamin biosynthesis protein CobD [Chloroflexota bacterium]
MLGLAVAYDLLLGEYAAALHPVVWMGWLAGQWLRVAPEDGPVRQLLFGAVMVCGVTGAFALPAWALLGYLSGQQPLLHLLAGAALLKPAFSIKALFTSTAAVGRALEVGELDVARTRASMIVSRDVGALGPPQVAAAAIESAAENLTDSVVAPLLSYLALGPAGALAYRAVNTLDAMVGYHGRYEYLGKAAARLDDLLNWAPARLAALLLVAAAAPAGGSAPGSWRLLLRDHGLTASPNAGWTMSAMAGALGVRLEKLGAYRLGAEAREPVASDLRRALRVLGGGVALALSGIGLAEVAIHAPAA